MLSRHHILIPISLSSTFLGAVRLGRDLASRLTRVTLLHVIENRRSKVVSLYQDRLPLSFIADKIRQLRNIRNIELTDIERVKMELVFNNNPPMVICEKAIHQSVDVITMNKYDQTDATQSSIIGILEEVLYKSPCPVLLVRSKQPLESSHTHVLKDQMNDRREREVSLSVS